MTIQAAPSEQSYAADGITTVFAIPFPFDTSADLKLTSTDASGTILTLSTGFTISGGGGSTGNATFSPAPAAGLTITIYDDPALTQPTNYVSLDAFPAESHERALDRVTRIAKRLYQRVQRCVRFPDGDTSTDGVLGSVANRKGKYLFFNAVTGAIEYAVNLVTTTLSQSIIGQLLNPQTGAELAAGSTPVNFFWSAGYVDRYATNTTPGTTGMGPALQAAINQALKSGGAPVRFGGSAYLINTKPTFGAVTINDIPLDIGGVGVSTQLICGLAAGTSPFFDMTASNGWWLHDLLIASDSAHKNIGVAVNGTGSPQAIEWRMSNVTSLMAGVGFKLQNTNTGVVENCRHWPGNNPALWVPLTVTNSDISHGLYLTGGFVHNTLITNFVCPPHSGYNATNTGIKCDAAASYGVTLINPLVQTLSGNNNEVGIDYSPSGVGGSLTILGAYVEGTILRLANILQSTISATDGAVGGAIILNSGCRGTKFVGCGVGVIDVADSTNWGNTFDGCLTHGPVAWSASVPYIAGNYVVSGGNNYKCILAHTNQVPPNGTYWVAFSAQSFNDAAEGNNLSAQPNRLMGCQLQGYSTGVPDLGSDWLKTFSVGAGGTFTPDIYTATWNQLRCAGNVTIAVPLHPRNGQRLGFTIRNESVGAITVTWAGGAGGFNAPPFTTPAAGQSRSAEYKYTSDFAGWRQLWYSGADVLN